MNTDNKEFLEKIGANIAKYRKAMGLTQVQFADKLKTNRSALARIESGKINSSILKLKEISDSLEIKIIQLLNNYEN